MKVFFVTGKYFFLARRNNADMSMLKKSWACEMVNHFNVSLQIKGASVDRLGPYLLLGNHISYLDIPILLSCCSDVSFVSKSEVSRWPVIGKAAILARTIFVKRDSVHSRAAAKIKIANAILNGQQRVAIFPSGTTLIRPAPFWKKGAFEIAKDHCIKIQPFRISYEPLRAAAYIDNDNLLLHMYQILKFKKINVFLEFHEPVKVQNVIGDSDLWKNWSEEYLQGGQYDDMGKRDSRNQSLEMEWN